MKTLFLHPVNQSGCSAVGSVPRSGRGGRLFESGHPDQLGFKRNTKTCKSYDLQVFLLDQFIS